MEYLREFGCRVLTYFSEPVFRLLITFGKLKQLPISSFLKMFKLTAHSPAISSELDIPLSIPDLLVSGLLHEYLDRGMRNCDLGALFPII